MDEEKRPLSEDEAIAFAGVTESTLHRYISAGFINPVTEGDQTFFDEDELIQVFELSPKKAAASRKALKKKILSPAEKLISEKDRLVADKDIQIRDLKDQRSWLQSRVERLESELQKVKTTKEISTVGVAQNTSIALLSQSNSNGSDSSSEGEQHEKIEDTTNNSTVVYLRTAINAAPPITTTVTSTLSPGTDFSHTEGPLKKVLRYLGFIKPEISHNLPAITSRASEIITLDRTAERVVTAPPSDEQIEINLVSDKTTADTSATPSNQPTTTMPIAPRGNRPFRESKQTLAELLGENRPLDPSFAANEEPE